MAQDLFQLAAAVKDCARRLGFDAAGIADAQPSRYRDYFRQWLDDGRAGTMAYLDRRFAERADPAVYLPGAASVVCLAMNYHVPIPPAPSSAAGQPRGRVARYAWGQDYHQVIQPKLHQLADWLRQQAPSIQTRCAVDTAPVMEKELAARSGIGWMGKNTCIINSQLGSWLFLAEILTTLALPADQPAADRCGSCTRCLEACPTQAITAAYQLDATRCISYLNIEHSGEIPADLHAPLGDWLYGCDVCQEVCPWNRRAAVSLEPALAPRFADGRMDLDQIQSWSAQDYRRHLHGSAMKRVKLPVLQRNARLISANAQVS
jgi:epoxyqueuosine reductase